MTALPKWIEKFPLLEQDESMREALIIAWEALEKISGRKPNGSIIDCDISDDTMRRITELGKE